jgi:hypothetical protein
MPKAGSKSTPKLRWQESTELAAECNRGLFRPWWASLPLYERQCCMSAAPTGVSRVALVQNRVIGEAKESHGTLAGFNIVHSSTVVSWQIQLR